MATDAAIGERRKEAVKRIEKAISGDNSEYRLEVPKKSQYGQAMMVLQTIECIADFIEKAPKQVGETVEVIPAKYLHAEELARNGGTKAEIIEALLSESEAENAPT